MERKPKGITHRADAGGKRVEETTGEYSRCCCHDSGNRRDTPAPTSGPWDRNPNGVGIDSDPGGFPEPPALVGGPPALVGGPGVETLGVVLPPGVETLGIETLGVVLPPGVLRSGMETGVAAVA